MKILFPVPAAMAPKANSKHPLPANLKAKVSNKAKVSSKDKDKGNSRELQPLEALKVVQEQAQIPAKVREPKRAYPVLNKAVAKAEQDQQVS